MNFISKKLICKIYNYKKNAKPKYNIGDLVVFEKKYKSPQTDKINDDKNYFTIEQGIISKAFSSSFYTKGWVYFIEVKRDLHNDFYVVDKEQIMYRLKNKK